MKSVRLNENIKMIGVKRFKGNMKQIDYYLIMPDQEKLYAFTKGYTRNTYEMCKSGITVNRLATKRTRDEGIMKLVKYTNYMLPYLAEIYELPVA